MAMITSFPVELVARVFEKMEVGDAWVARGVCRLWYDVFDFVAYSSQDVYLGGTRMGVEVVCGITSAKGLQDSHVVHDELEFAQEARGPGARTAKWICERQEYVYWPGGNWRMYGIGEVLTEVNLHIKTTTSKTDTAICLGHDIGLGDGVRQPNVSAIAEGKFKDFALSLDEREETSRSGKTYNKHGVVGFTAPKWQIYSLLAHHAKIQRERSETLRQHYVGSWDNIYNYAMDREERTRRATDGWM